MKESITQEHMTGCAVACVAYLMGVSYQRALEAFKSPHQAWGQGFYCDEIVEALGVFGKNYFYDRLTVYNRSLLEKPDVIVFVEPNRRYPLGHYLARSSQCQWMNSWVNCPVIAPAQSGFERKLPGLPSYVIFNASSCSLK
ncbi:MAG: hypothetical protein ACO3A2_09910 [Bdellovibrionia bacterium]